MLSDEKHCELLAANARVAGDAMRDGFKLFIQLFSAIVGGSIALRLSSPIDPNIQTAVARLAEWLALFVGFVSALLIADSFRSWWRHRNTLTRVAGKNPNDGKNPKDEDVVPPPDFQSWTTVILMEIVILVCIWAFWTHNPLRLAA